MRKICAIKILKRVKRVSLKVFRSVNILFILNLQRLIGKQIDPKLPVPSQLLCHLRKGKHKRLQDKNLTESRDSVACARCHGILIGLDVRELEGSPFDTQQHETDEVSVADKNTLKFCGMVLSNPSCSASRSVGSVSCVCSSSVFHVLAAP